MLCTHFASFFHTQIWSAYETVPWLKEEVQTFFVCSDLRKVERDEKTMKRPFLVLQLVVAVRGICVGNLCWLNSALTHYLNDCCGCIEALCPHGSESAFLSWLWTKVLWKFSFNKWLCHLIDPFSLQFICWASALIQVKVLNKLILNPTKMLCRENKNKVDRKSKTCETGAQKTPSIQLAAVTPAVTSPTHVSIKHFFFF